MSLRVAIDVSFIKQIGGARTEPRRSLAAMACFSARSNLPQAPPSGPILSRALLSRDPAVFVQPCRLTISLIQIGAKGDVQPFDTG